jgi:hypothetical protein
MRLPIPPTQTTHRGGFFSSGENMSQYEVVTDLANKLNQTHRELYEERAGILQFDAGIPLVLAEALGMLYVLSEHPDALIGVM